MKVFLGIDPGRTIGYAKVSVGPGEDGKLTILSIEVDQEFRGDWKASGSKPIAEVENCDVLAIEDFVGAGVRTSESNHVLRQIGAFELMGAIHGKHVIVQAPAKRRKYLKTAERLYLQETGEEVCHHGKDALAHALKAIATEMTMSPKDWIKK